MIYNKQKWKTTVIKYIKVNKEVTEENILSVGVQKKCITENKNGLKQKQYYMQKIQIKGF